MRSHTWTYGCSSRELFIVIGMRSDQLSVQYLIFVPCYFPVRLCVKRKRPANSNLLSADMIFRLTQSI